jgi:hypothetical protein
VYWGCQAAYGPQAAWHPLQYCGGMTRVQQ